MSKLEPQQLKKDFHFKYLLFLHVQERDIVEYIQCIKGVPKFTQDLNLNLSDKMLSTKKKRQLIIQDY